MLDNYNKNERILKCTIVPCHKTKISNLFGARVVRKSDKIFVSPENARFVFTSTQRVRLGLFNRKINDITESSAKTTYNSTCHIHFYTKIYLNHGLTRIFIRIIG